MGTFFADPYVYPGTEILKNRRNIKDQEKLTKVEAQHVLSRLKTLPSMPMTAKGFLAIHKHLFGGLYDWAGQIRTVDTTKGQTMFAYAAYAEKALTDQFAKLAKENLLRDRPGEGFAQGAAHHISELNAIHPFRDGNGRTMRIHLVQLAAQAGHQIDITKIARDDWINASIEGFNGDERLLTRAIAGALEPMPAIERNVEIPIETALGQLYTAIVPAWRQAVEIWKEVATLAKADRPSADIVRQLTTSQRLVAELGDRAHLAGDLVILRAAKVTSVTLPAEFSTPMEQVKGIRQAAAQAVAKLGPAQLREAKLSLKQREIGRD